MQPSKPFLTVPPPVIPPPTQLVIEGYFLILTHIHTATHTCWYLWLSSLANALLSIVMLWHYSFLKFCPPSPGRISLSCGWLHQFLQQLFCIYMCTHAHAHTHTHTHTIHQPNRNQFMPFLCLKLWNGFPKCSKYKNPKFLPQSTRPYKTWPSPNSSSCYVPSRQVSFLIHTHSTSISFLTSAPLHYLPPCESVSPSVVCPTLWDPTDCSPPGSSIHGSFQARILPPYILQKINKLYQSRSYVWFAYMYNTYNSIHPIVRTQQIFSDLMVKPLHQNFYFCLPS